MSQERKTLQLGMVSQTEYKEGVKAMRMHGFDYYDWEQTVITVPLDVALNSVTFYLEAYNDFYYLNFDSGLFIQPTEIDANIPFLTDIRSKYAYAKIRNQTPVITKGYEFTGLIKFTVSTNAANFGTYDAITIPTYWFRPIPHI